MKSKIRNGVAVVSAFMGVLALAACSGSDDGRVAGGVTEDAGVVAVKDLNVAGVSQKGPFVKGSAVTVQGVDCKTLKFTDEVFSGEVKSDKGDFVVESVTLSSTCAVFEVTGNYQSEITGKKTAGELTLRALTDLKDRKNVNVNLLTNLEYERVMHLVKEDGKSFAEAKSQAEKEVLAAFDIEGCFEAFENLNIFESGDGNAALLAVSVMMQSDVDEVKLAKRIDEFEDSFAESGKWNDTATKTAISEWQIAATASGKLDSIRENVESWGYADSVPAFEKYVEAFADSDDVEESSSLNDDSSSSVAPDSPAETSSSSVASADSVTSSSSSVTLSEVEGSSSSEAVAATNKVLSSSSDAASSSSEAVRDTSVRDTSVRDTTARDTSVLDTGSVNPDTSATANDTACTDTKFPYEMEYLIGNGYEVVSARCVGDSIVVDWRSQHVIHEIEVSDSGTYVFSTDYEKDVMDSLARLRSEWLDEGSGFVSRGSINADRDELAMDVYGYSYSDRDINASMGRIDNVTSLYSFTMNLKYAAYFIRAFSAPEVLVAASGSRTVRYGFVVELSAIYLTK